ncbi:MAG: hydrogenase maturation protease [Betaproteobacteria bacterium]|nr:hydrogenase maturation protease [Betaproteobacteria bacterium]
MATAVAPHSVPREVLVFAYGNPSRGDDALGPELLKAAEEFNAQQPDAFRAELIADFQLQVEHVTDLKGRDLVLFLDASVSCPPPFAFGRVRAEPDLSYTTHAVTPAGLLHVYRQVFGEEPPASYVLTVRGERFGLGDGLSSAARERMAKARELLQWLLEHPHRELWDSRTG